KALTVTQNNAAANGRAENEVQVTVQDANGNPVNGAVVSLAADHQAKIAATVTTDKDGQAKAPLTSILAGSVTVTASVQGGKESKMVTATFYTYEFHFRTESISLGVFQKRQIKVYAVPTNNNNIKQYEDVNNKIFTWATTDNKIATVDSNGIVTGKANGKTKIKATLKNEKYKDIPVNRNIMGRVSVAPIEESEIFGGKQGQNQQFIVEPPNYEIRGSSGWIIDSLGVGSKTPAGGNGGTKKVVSSANITAIEMTIVKNNYFIESNKNNGENWNLVRISFKSKNGRVDTIGIDGNACNLELNFKYSTCLDKKYEIPNGRVFVGMRVYYGRYIHGIKILTTPGDY
ncbi:TPA: Ig-like domain-containing protein, partial [Klebsiella aerogenes]|nr:Ig-like domain-containing protein [Klebsiella aerogenes]